MSTEERNRLQAMDFEYAPTDDASHWCTFPEAPCDHQSHAHPKTGHHRDCLCSLCTNDERDDGLRNALFDIASSHPALNPETIFSRFPQPPRNEVDKMFCVGCWDAIAEPNDSLCAECKELS